jgi:two-component system, NtrC family, sensor kinase
MRRRFESGLAARMGLALCLGAAAVLVAAGTWNLRLERAHLERLVGLSADRIAEIIRGATRDGMMRNDAAEVHRTVENIGAQPGIARIRIFNKEGRIRISTRPEEVGRLVDVRAEQCTACHRSDRPLERLSRADRVRIFRDHEGQRILGVIAPIHNEPQCTTACHDHPPEQHVLGVLDVQLSMAGVDESLEASERQMSITLVGTVAAMLLLSGGLLWRLVLRPVRRLTLAMTGAASGDLTSRVPVTSTDEIGQMALRWNGMTEELGRAREELTGWNRSLEHRIAEKTRELEQAHGRMMVAEKMASLGKLAAVVAHEINNPLAGIRTYARVLRRRPGVDEETRRILEMMDGEAGRCGDIVRNLLLFSRTPAARFAEEEIPPLLERCRLLLRHRAEMGNVELGVEAPDDLPRLLCDAAQVQQLALALLMNALEATPAGGRVVLSARGAGDEIVLTVSDTGCGIPEEQIPHIFEPFFTTKERGNGVGLGLAVVYGIVERHHGRIEVRSRPGEGTTVTVHLPRQRPQETGGEP